MGEIFMIFTFSHRGSKNVFFTLFRCRINVETREQGRKLVFRAAMRKSKNHEYSPILHVK